MARPLSDWVKRIVSIALGRMQAGRDQRRMALIETLNLGGKRQLMLVQCDEQVYLIGTGGDSVHSIQAITCGGNRDIEDGSRSQCDVEAPQAGVRHFH